MTEQEPTFTTERLRVWEIVANPSGTDQTMTRRMYIACIKGEVADWPGVAVSLSVGVRNYIDWMQTADTCLREGYAMELLDAVTDRIGTLIADGTSTAGDGLAEAYRKKHNAPTLLESLEAEHGN